jgi:hypothetical protein
MRILVRTAALVLVASYRLLCPGRRWAVSPRHQRARISVCAANRSGERDGRAPMWWLPLYLRHCSHAKHRHRLDACVAVGARDNSVTDCRMTRVGISVTFAAVTVACGADRVAQSNPRLDTVSTCLSSVTVNPATATLHPGDTLRLHADACRIPSSTGWWWRSSDTVVAAIDSAGGLVLARSRGTATMTARALSDPNVSALALVNVVP